MADVEKLADYVKSLNIQETEWCLIREYLAGDEGRKERKSLEAVQKTLEEDRFKVILEDLRRLDAKDKPLPVTSALQFLNMGIGLAKSWYDRYVKIRIAKMVDLFKNFRKEKYEGGMMSYKLITLQPYSMHSCLIPELVTNVEPEIEPVESKGIKMPHIMKETQDYTPNLYEITDEEGIEDAAACPLGLAAQQSCFAVVKALLQIGSDVDLLTNNTKPSTSVTKKLDLELSTTPVQAETDCPPPRQDNSNSEASYNAADSPPYNETIDLQDRGDAWIFKQYSSEGRKSVKIPHQIDSDYILNSYILVYNDLVREINLVKHLKCGNEKKNLSKDQRISECSERAEPKWTVNQKKNVVSQEQSENVEEQTLSDSARSKYDDGPVENSNTSATDIEEEVDEIRDANNVIQTDKSFELSQILLDLSGGECNEDASPLGYDDTCTVSGSFNTQCRGMMANDPWELTSPKDEDDSPVWMRDADDIGEADWFGQVDRHCNIVDGLAMSDFYMTCTPVMSDKVTVVTLGRRRVYLLQEPDITTFINVVEGSPTRIARQGFCFGLQSNVWKGHLNSECTERAVVAGNLNENTVIQEQSEIEVDQTPSDSVRDDHDDGPVENDNTTDDEEEVDEIHDADNVIQRDESFEPPQIPLEVASGGEYDEDSSRLGYDDTMYRTFNTWCTGMTANDPWELTCPEDEEDNPVWISDADDIGEEELFGQVDRHCNIVDGWSVTDSYKSNCLMSDRTQDPRRVYLFQEPDGATSINVVEGSAISDGGQSFSSSFLVSCLSLVTFTQKLKKKVPSESDVKVGVPLMKSTGTWTLEKPFRPRMTMKNIALKEVAWLLIALVASIAGSAAAFSPNYTATTLKNVMIDPATSKDGLLGLGRVELKNIICDEAYKILRKTATPIEDDMKILYKLGRIPHVSHWGNPKKDFLRDVLNVPDCIQFPLQVTEVYPVFEQRGYEDEFTRLASYGRCPEQKWYPAVPLAENGFYFEPDSSVICYFCKSKSNTWQRDWNPKLKHEPDCPFLNGNDCGNIPMEPSRENGTHQPAIQSAMDELQIPQLQNKNKVLLRNSTRSVESFKNPQIPPENQMGSLSINVTQGQGRQEHDAMEDEPQPSTSNANSSQQQHEGAGGLRYFVHSYDNSGRPISTSQKMEFSSNEEKANTSMKKETDRLKSFDSVWKKGDVISPQELAKSGFYYAGTGDRVRCAFCNGVLRNWAVGDRAAAEHRRHYPTCPFVLNLNVGNIPSNPDLSDLHTSTAATTNHTEQRRPAARTPGQQSTQSNFGAAITPSAVPGTILIPKHSNFSTVESRLLTYDSWPSCNVQRPNELAEAGFFYTGSSDNVRCFHCDGGLRNWLDSDMPWIEHAKWFPRCGFLQRVKGVEFVLEETRKHNQQNFTTALAQNRGSTGLATTPTQGVGIVERPSAGGVRRVEAREVRARFDTDRVKMVLDMGYKEAVVKYVILQRLRYTGDDFPNTQEMLESVLAEEPNLEEKGIAYYENILQQEFGRPMTIVYPHLTGGKSDKTAVPPPAPPMTQTTSASLVIPEDEKSLVEENRQLKEQTTCKICMDNEVSMVFVPCGHLVACADCAPNLRECPICRRKITGTIRTFLS